MLRRAGVEVCEAENGAEALQRVEEESFDLVLMDMQMPVMDGYAATRRLREQGYTMPIVAMTANAMQGDEDKCKEAGCSHFLIKPIDIDRLFELLAETLGECEQDERPAATTQATDDTVPPGSGVGNRHPREPIVSGRSDGSHRPQVVSRLLLDDPGLRPAVEKFVRTLLCGCRRCWPTSLAVTCNPWQNMPTG